ncbi:MAG: nicotinate (nicotinamide) nucleotide adenylyltransferase [Clostridia bacterium]
MRLAILGGTFDPVHNAHLAMARAALEALAPDRVVFMPTGKAAYRNAAVASADDRVAMLKLALAGEPRFSLDERELAPGASGYTVDTLRALRAELPAAELYFLLGADQLEKFSAWHAPEEIRRLARLAVFARPGHPVGDRTVQVVPMAPTDVSASAIRERAARGESLAGLVPPPVANYIERKGIYR